MATAPSSDRAAVRPWLFRWGISQRPAPVGCGAPDHSHALGTPEVSRQKANFGQGDAVLHISAAALGSVTVRLPTLDEQVAIGTVLADMDTELAALEARRDKTSLLKQGRMHALLTGRIRLV